ncbi:MAG: hypothetical protein IJC57_00590 [Clostridia bacterium]|nr:hypothetical protein [Clostridia bacterium]
MLSIADKIIISEILAVREENIYNIHATDLTKKIQNSVYIPSFEEISEYIINNIQPGDMIVTLSGGNIYKLANTISNKLKNIYN